MKETRFKETEIGLFPEDWKDATIQDLGPISKGKGISRAECGTGNIPCVRYGEIYKDYDNYIKSFQSFISKEVAKTSRKLQYGELLFTGSGETKEDIGKCVAFVGNEEAYAGGDIIIVNPNLEDNNPLFLGFLMNDKYIISQKALRGQGDAVVHITSKTLATVQMVLPPLDEQTRIASALTAIDNLISSLDKLIEKKKNIKQGTMQQLLTGKKRLKGFSELWIEKRLGEILSLRNGFAFKSETYSSTDNYKIITIANVQNGKLDLSDYNTIKDIPASIQHHQILSKGDILVSMTGNIGRVCRVDSPNCLLNQRVGLLDIKSGINSDFVFTALNTTVFENAMRDKGQGAAQANIGKSDIEDYLIMMPSNEMEQIAIVKVFAKLDAEIISLEKRKNKFIAIKQGMMQQLLTGKIRLV